MTSHQSVTQEQDIQVTLVTEWCADSVTGEMSHWHWRHRRPGATAVPRLRSLPCQWSPHSPLTTRWRLYCRHCTPHIIGGIIIIRMETSRHSGSQTILSHLYILYSRFSACLRTWHWPVMVKWLVSGEAVMQSYSHAVMLMLTAYIALHQIQTVKQGIKWSLSRVNGFTLNISS